LLDALVFSGNINLVSDVMVGGSWVVRDGRHLRRDEIAEAYRGVLTELV
jgi:formimidoylglutamate deiminase